MDKKYNNLRELFSEKKRWTKGELAQDKKGNRVSPSSEEACKWCLIGGLLYLNDGEWSEEFCTVTYKIQDVLDRRGINPNGLQVLQAFNDSKETTYELLMEVLTEAEV